MWCGRAGDICTGRWSVYSREKREQHGEKRGKARTCRDVCDRSGGCSGVRGGEERPHRKVPVVRVDILFACSFSAPFFFRTWMSEPYFFFDPWRKTNQQAFFFLTLTISGILCFLLCLASHDWSLLFDPTCRADYWSPRLAGGLLARCLLLFTSATRWQQETCQFLFHVVFRSSPLLWGGTGTPNSRPHWFQDGCEKRVG